jgi:hypothetical protein
VSYAQIIDGQIASIGRLPKSARRLDNGAWVMGLATAPANMQEACGYFAYTETERPADTETTTFTRSVEVVDGRPAVVWTESPKPEPAPVVLPLEQRVDNLRTALEALGTPATTPDVIEAIVAALSPTPEPTPAEEPV